MYQSTGEQSGRSTSYHCRSSLTSGKGPLHAWNFFPDPPGSFSQGAGNIFLSGSGTYGKQIRGKSPLARSGTQTQNCGGGPRHAFPLLWSRKLGEEDMVDETPKSASPLDGESALAEVML